MRHVLLMSAVVLLMGLPTNLFAQWYGSVDFIVPTRSVTDHVYQRNVVVTTTTTGTPPVTTTTETVGTQNLLDVDFGSVAGARGTFGIRGGLFGMESGFLFTDEWDATASLFDPSGLLASPFTTAGTTPDPDFDNNTFASIRYRSELQSAQWNMTYMLYEESDGAAMGKLGVRAMWIDEQFDYFTENATTQNVLALDTDNELLGPQVGVTAYTNAPGGRLGLNVLGGFAYNRIERLDDFNGVATSVNTSEGSLFGELGIEYNFLPTPNLALRVGFQFLGVTNVGLAVDNPLLSPNQTDEVVYYIPYVGLGRTF